MGSLTAEKKTHGEYSVCSSNMSDGTYRSLYVEPTRYLQDYKQASYTQLSILTRWSSVMTVLAPTLGHSSNYPTVVHLAAEQM